MLLCIRLLGQSPLGLRPVPPLHKGAMTLYRFYKVNNAIT